MNTSFFSAVIALCGLCLSAHAETQGLQLMDLLEADSSIFLEPNETPVVEETKVFTPPVVEPTPAQAPDPAPVVEAINLPVTVPVQTEPVVVKTTSPVAPVLPPTPMPKAVSQLTVVEGTNDISIIFSNKEFFPSQIKMKKTAKTRLIFTTTEKKPAALVFEKQKIYRWLAADSEKIPSEYRELNPSRISEIYFDAEPGMYRFYDAMSGAQGEIQVD
jgi:hypothetical protein